MVLLWVVRMVDGTEGASPSGTPQ